MADKTAFGPISIASRFVIFNGSCSRRRISCRRFPADWPDRKNWTSGRDNCVWRRSDRAR